MIKRRHHILYYLLFILTYVGLYFTSSYYLMAYEDFWDDSEGEIWSLDSMAIQEKIAYFVWFIPNFPLGLILPRGLINLISVCIINPVIVGWILQKVFNKNRDETIEYANIVNAILITTTLLMLMYLFS